MSNALRIGNRSISYEQAKEMLDAGASLIEIYSGFIYEGPALIKNINKHLENTL